MKSLQSSDHQPPKTKTKYPTRPPKGIQNSDRTTPPDRLNLSVLTASRRLTLRDSELGLTRPALGADYYLTSLTSVKHREDGGF